MERQKSKFFMTFLFSPENEDSKKNPLLLRVHEKRPLKNVQFCSSSRKAKILNAGIH